MWELLSLQLRSLGACHDPTRKCFCGNTGASRPGTPDWRAHHDVQLLLPTSELMPSAKSNNLSGDPELITGSDEPDASAPMPVVLHGEGWPQGAVLPPVVNQDDYIRDPIREEIGHLLCAALQGIYKARRPRGDIRNADSVSSYMGQLPPHFACVRKSM